MHRFGTDPLDIQRVVELSTATEELSLPPDVQQSLQRSHDESVAASVNNVAYGRTTGVGANRNVAA
ncbi:MAG: hypothetical protein EBZ55_05250, partial [Actinobacteria bacterium]|nr:hypothetical protein [Actinomycetota bacterium]